MAGAQKFLFTTRFDKGAESAPQPSRDEPPPPPPPPTFSEEDLERTRAEAFAEGHKAGTAEASATTERQVATALTAIAQRLQTMTQHQSEANEMAARNAVRVAMAVARKVLPETARRNGLGEVQAVLDECVAHLSGEARMRVRVNGSLIEPLREKLAALPSIAGDEMVLDMVADDRLAIGDCRAEWETGGCERLTDRLWQDLDGIIERALGMGSGHSPPVKDEEFPGDET